jgi:hypothetical protein
MYHCPEANDELAAGPVPASIPSGELIAIVLPLAWPLTLAALLTTQKARRA